MGKTCNSANVSVEVRVEVPPFLLVFGAMRSIMWFASQCNDIMNRDLTFFLVFMEIITEIEGDFYGRCGRVI